LNLESIKENILSKIDTVTNDIDMGNMEELNRLNLYLSLVNNIDSIDTHDRTAKITEKMMEKIKSTPMSEILKNR
jgi:hypothetical protein